MRSYSFNLPLINSWYVPGSRFFQLYCTHGFPGLKKMKILIESLGEVVGALSTSEDDAIAPGLGLGLSSKAPA